jgi:hypothetical protein
MLEISAGLWAEFMCRSKVQGVSEGRHGLVTGGDLPAVGGPSTPHATLGGCGLPQDTVGACSPGDNETALKSH